MEKTPSTMRKASSASYKTKQEGTKMDRAALIDITNDSPITGLANGSFTKSPVKDRTPGSGEALLRGQVKNLLQKVEEGNKIPSFSRNLIPPSQFGFVPSSLEILAPTPANTPQIAPLVVNQGFLQPPPQIVAPVLPSFESLGPCMINRALLFDESPDKQETSSVRATKTPSSLSFNEVLEISSTGSNSSVTCQKNLALNEKSRFVSPHSDNSSDWSIRALAGTEEEFHEALDELDELCEGVKKMNVFEGKHVRFVYNSNDEIEGEVECIEKRAELDSDDESEGEVECIEKRAEADSDDEIEGEVEFIENRVEPESGVIVLKGLPVPEGKHLRFHEDEEED